MSRPHLATGLTPSETTIRLIASGFGKKWRGQKGANFLTCPDQGNLDQDFVQYHVKHTSRIDSQNFTGQGLLTGYHEQVTQSSIVLFPFRPKVTDFDWQGNS